MAEAEGEYTLYATDDTLLKAGWAAEHLTSIANKNIILITPEDIEENGGLRNLMDTLGVSIAPTPMQKMLMPDLDDEAMQRTFFEGVESGLQGEPGAAMPIFTPSYYADETSTQPDTYLIQVELGHSPEEWAVMFSGLESSDVIEMPGDAEDYNAFIMFHEAGHAGHGINLADGNAKEVRADQIAVNEFRKAVAEGMPLDPRVPDMMMDFRATNALGRYNGFDLINSRESTSMMGRSPYILAHTTETFINLDGGDVDYAELSSLDKLEGVAAVNSLVNGLCGYVIDEQTGASLEPIGLSDFWNSLAASDAERLADMGQENFTPESALMAFDTLYHRGAFERDPDMKLYADKVMLHYEEHMPQTLADIRGSEDYALYKNSADKFSDRFGEFTPEALLQKASAPHYESGKPTSEKIAAALVADENVSASALGSIFGGPELAPPVPKPPDLTPSMPLVSPFSIK